MLGYRGWPGEARLRRLGAGCGGRAHLTMGIGLVRIGLVLAGLLLAASPADAKRVAFVVGVNKYENLGPDLQLAKAVADAKAIADTFASLGFQVVKGENTKRNAFFQAWQRFLNMVQPGDVAALYFAGHGVEIQNTNYILTSDIPEVADGADVMKSSAIEVSALLDRLKEQQPQVVLAIIDACRDNPFAKRGTRGVGSGAGLGATDPPKGMLQMMSAGKGETALDALSENDTNPNSVYTRLLIPLLKQPGLEITEVALRVRSEVTELARTVGHDQSPAFYHELSGKFYLTEPRAAPVVADAARATNVTPDAAQAWAAVSETRSIAVLESFARRYSDTIYGDLARTRISEINRGPAASPAPSAAPAMRPSAAEAALAAPATHPVSSVFQAAQAWAAIKDSSDAPALEAFAAQYGDTIYGPMAQARIDQLKRTSVASAAPAESVRSTAPTDKPAALEAGQAWNNTKNTDNPVVLERFIKQYGETIYGPPAQARLAELRNQPTAVTPPSQPVIAAGAPGALDAAQAWGNTRNTTNPAVVEHFLRQYGDSIYADQARAKLKQLKREP
jgi:uncharacterized caspase-like protein